MGAALDLGRQWVIAWVRSFVVVSSASARAAGSRGTGASGDGAAAVAVAQGKSAAASREARAMRGLLVSRPVSRILFTVTIPLCSNPVPRRAA